MARTYAISFAVSKAIHHGPGFGWQEMFRSIMVSVVATKDGDTAFELRTPPAATPQRVADAAHMLAQRSAVVTGAGDFKPATGAEFVEAAQSAIEPRSDEEIFDIISDLETR